MIKQSKFVLYWDRMNYFYADLCCHKYFKNKKSGKIFYEYICAKRIKMRT